MKHAIDLSFLQNPAIRRILTNWQTQLETERFDPREAKRIIREIIIQDNLADKIKNFPFPNDVIDRLIEKKRLYKDEHLELQDLLHKLTNQLNGLFAVDNILPISFNNLLAIVTVLGVLFNYWNAPEQTSQIRPCRYCWRTAVQSFDDVFGQEEWMWTTAISNQIWAQPPTETVEIEWACGDHCTHNDSPDYRNPDRRTSIRLAHRVVGQSTGWQQRWDEVVRARTWKIFDRFVDFTFKPQNSWEAKLFAAGAKLEPKPPPHWWIDPLQLIARRKAILTLSTEYTRKVWIQAVPRDDRSDARKRRNEQERHALDLVFKGKGKKSYRSAAEEAGLGKGYAGTLCRKYKQELKRRASASSTGKLT